MESKTWNTRAVLLERKSKLIELINSSIITLKMLNSNNHPTRTSLVKTTFIKNSFQYVHDQFVVAAIDNGNVAFICERL